VAASIAVFAFAPAFHGSAEPIGPQLRERMTGASWHRELYRLRFPIRRMRLVDAYGADDHRSMDADNTSAFNCRFVAGTSRWSEHAYGHAIDVNPIENPYVTSDGYVSPPAGAPYKDRARQAEGMIHRQGPVVAAFRKNGWKWAGVSWPKDYQHFSVSGH
jgi:hypothetical protein